MAQKHDFFVGFLEPENNEKDLAKFICETDIWLKFFGNKDTYAKLQFALFGKKGTEKLDGPHIRHKVTGYDAWGDHANFFLEYCTNKEKYDHFWGTQDFELSKCLESFRRFNRSIPQVCTKKPEHQIFLIPARKIRIYLEAISKFCYLCPDPDNNSNKKWRNAGMYTLISLFVQNGSISPECKTPKGLGLTTLLYEIKHISGISALKALLNEINEVDNFEGLEDLLRQFEHCIGSNSTEEAEDTNMLDRDISTEEVNVVEAVFKPYKHPKESFSAPETGVLPFDLFALAHRHFKPQPCEELSFPAVTLNSVITPAEIHRKYVPISGGISYHEGGFWNTLSRFFLIEERLVRDGFQWNLQHKLAPIIPFQEDAFINFEINTTAFEDDCHRKVVEVDFREGHDFCQLIPWVLTESKFYSCQQECRFCLNICITESGYYRDQSTEATLSFFGIEEYPKSAQHYSHRTAAVRFRREYLDYQFFDVETLTELPVTQSQDPETGEDLLSITIPCPCQLLIFQNKLKPLSTENAMLLYVSGHIHGIYGLEQNVDQAVRHMSQQTYNSHITFQYGAYLRAKGGATKQAEISLRRAGNIPGALFELASLLKDKNTPESLEEAEKIIDELWNQGYRTYGAHTSIDLLNKHTR